MPVTGKGVVSRQGQVESFKGLINCFLRLVFVLGKLFPPSQSA